MSIGHAFTRAVRGVDVPRISLHGTRHTHATILLRAGVPLTIVSRRLGHETISQTADVYGHHSTEDDRQASTVVGGVFRRVV